MFILVIFGLFVVQAESYVLLQVRKQDNNFSNIDALIHKVVPSDKVEKIASKLGRKQVKINKDHVKPNAVRKTEDVDEKRPATEKVRERNIKDIEESILNLARKDRPVFRSQDKYVSGVSQGRILVFIIIIISPYTFYCWARASSTTVMLEPKIINFRSGKPSVVFEVDSKAVIKTIKNLLSSDKFQTYMDTFAKQAAIAYRTIKKEIDKEGNV